MASVLAATTGSGTRQISEGYAILVLVLMCTYVVGYGLSWGPLSWLISSEIYPLKIRTTSQSINVAIYYGVTFLVAQFFLTMLCHFKFGAFLFYAGWIAVMTIFVALFLPETKGIPLDSMHAVWERHWFWRRFVIPGQLQGHSHWINCFNLARDRHYVLAFKRMGYCIFIYFFFFSFLFFG